MTNHFVHTTIDILGKPYPIRCPESELAALEKAAAFLNQQMSEVKESGKAITLERIAIMTALNIAHQFLQLDQQKHGLMSKINQRITQLQNKLDTAINHTLQTEFIYSAEME